MIKKGAATSTKSIDIDSIADIDNIALKGIKGTCYHMRRERPSMEYAIGLLLIPYQLQFSTLLHQQISTELCCRELEVLTPNCMKSHEWICHIFAKL